MMNDIGNNAFRIGNAGMANQSSIDEDMSSLEQAGQEILNVLGGGRRSSSAGDLNLAQYVANQVWNNPENQFRGAGEAVEVAKADDTGYLEAIYGEFYA